MYSYPVNIRELVENKNFSKAIKKFFSFLRKDSYNVYAWCDLGYCYLNVNNYYEAIRILKTALMLSKEKGEKEVRPVIYLNLAQAYKLNKDYKESQDSISEFFKLIEGDENDDNYTQAIKLKEDLENIQKK